MSRLRRYATRALGRLPAPLLHAVGSVQWRFPWVMRYTRLVTDRLRDQDGTIQQGLGAGLRFNPGGSNVEFILGINEPGVQKALAALIRPGMTVYDVGANVGYITCLAARLVGVGGRVVAFEPVPRNAAQVRHNAALNGFARVRVREEAVAEADGEATFNLSSLATVGRLASVGPAAHQVGETTVRVRALDSVLAEGEPPPHLLKIDVEGAEGPAIRGASELLRAHQPLVMIELHGTNAEVEEALRERGYVTRVLGAREGVVEAPPDAYVLAAPEGKPEWLAALDALTDPAVETR